MNGDLYETIERLRSAASAVGRNGLHARTQGRYSVNGDIEELAVALGEATDDSPACSVLRRRQCGGLALSAYRLARGLLGPIPSDWSASGDDVVDLVQGRVGFGKLPMELIEVADLLIADAGGGAHDEDLWIGFETGVMIAVVVTTLAQPDHPNAA